VDRSRVQVAASGTARDSLYTTQQKAAHAEALALHQDSAAKGTAPALKAASAKIVPVVQHHKIEAMGRSGGTAPPAALKPAR